MQYFDKDFLAFFKELENNNSKEWFDENRKRYEKSVKIPFKNFMEGMAEALAKIHPGIDLKSNIRIMRINRDIRFSKDKTPYKIHMAGSISPYGKKDMSKPGFFVQANHNDVRVYSGVYSPEKEDLLAIREDIADNLKEFKKLISAKAFKDTYGEVLGEKNKRLPKELQEAGEKEPLVYNKHFYWFFKLKPQTLLADDLAEQLMKKYKNCLPVNAFFEKALGVK